MTAIERGDIVIINDCDEPSARMCAVVTSTEPTGLCRALYLTTWRKTMNECAGHNATKIEDFGQLAVFKNGEMQIVTVGESRAKYRDGIPRFWQDRQNGVWHKCRKAALRLVSKKNKEIE
jgi:hypothetical protein